MDSSEEFFNPFDEPPRKRRAAALAAQKNWQMLNKPDDEMDLIEEEMIIVNRRESFPKPIELKTNNISIVPQNSPKTPIPPKKTSFPETIIIDMANKNKKKNRIDNNVVDNDCDYDPTQELVIRKDFKAKKSFPTPLRKINVNNSINNNSNSNRINSSEVIRIESDVPRVIAISKTSHYKKPVVIKLHPNEPLDLPVVEDEVEEVVGTYEVEDEEHDVRQTDESIDDLEMDVFCASNDVSQEIKDNESDDIIEVIEESADKDSKSVNPSVRSTSPTKKVITFSRKERQLIYKSSHLESNIGTLEMECENFDDEFTDCLCFDCEDDILNNNQWNQSNSTKKEYEKYVNSVKSTKNIKFLPESEVEDPIGIVTTTVSETTRAVTIPTRTPPALRTRPQNVLLSQAIRTPIPSTVNRVNLLSSQRPQRMASMPSMQPINSIPVQSPTINGLPLTLVPVSNTSGISSPLILAPNASNIVSPSMPTLPPGVRVILSPATHNQTYIMMPRSNTTTIVGTNGIQTPNMYLSNQNNLLQQNFITNTIPQNIRLTTQTQPRYRSATPIINPSQYIRTNMRQTIPRQPLVNNYGSIINRFSNPALNNQTMITLNTDFSNGANQTLPNQRNDPIFDCLTVLKGNQSKKINMRNVLTIKPLPFSWPSNIDDLISSLIRLDNALMKEKFKESPIAWMVSAQLITPPKCNACQKGICNQVNRTQNGKNEYWQCNNQRCSKSFVIDRPRIFAGTQFDIPVSKLLFIIYYWSIQVDVEDLIKSGQIEMGTEIIFNIWQKLQKVCSIALSTKDSKLGSTMRIVDIASVQVGRFYVLGAMEAVSFRTKICVVPISSVVQQNGKNAIFQPFVKWLERGTNVRTCESKFMALRDFGFNVTLQTKSEFLAVNKNLSLSTIGGYLIHHLQRLFKDFDLSTLTHDILSNILEELLWRERYGTNPYSAFYNIIKHIAEQCGIRKVDQMGSAVQITTPSRPVNTINTIISTPNLGRPSSRPPSAVLVQQPVDPNTIFVDEYYYSSLNLKSSFAKSIANEDESTKVSIQCHLCQMFFDNILIIKHLLEHLEKERRGRVRKGDNNESECKHCLRFFNNRTLHMHDELTNLKLIPYSCRICSLPFYARHPFIQHMKTSHFSGEMPYYCEICCYRSSFQKNLLDHFEADHSSVSSVMCPFCIRIFELSKFKNLSQFIYRHLATHYAVASVYDCDKCVLTFTTKADLREHCFKGHNPSNAIDEKFEIQTYVVPEEEKALCVRAKEQELFTPNLPTFGNNESVPNAGPQNESIESLEVNCEISCDPFATDFLIEPECQISFNESNQNVDNFLLPVDKDYTREQMRLMLSNSFDLSEECESYPQKDLILVNDKTMDCFECNTLLSIDHFINKTVCEKCNYSTHCNIAFTQHINSAHSAQRTPQQTTILGIFPQHFAYDLVCNECDFTTKDGNQMANHMIRSTHLCSLCKPLSPKI